MGAQGIDDRLVNGRYVRREQLGRGGFGIVWRAHDTLLQRDVAVKEVVFPPVLTDEEQAAVREKVLAEARAAARLNHPGLVVVFDVVEDDRRPYIVMELVDAPNVAEIVERDGPIPEQRVAQIGLELIDALVVAHEQGIIHRDVKPANVMVSASGRVQLTDFGIASILDDPKVTSSGQLAGSPSYMAPEQAQNLPTSAATDLWGLGATLFFAVEGAPPFEKDGAIATLTSVVSDEPRDFERAKNLAPLLRDLLHKSPEARPSAGETRRRLREVAAGPPPEPDRSRTVQFDADAVAAAMAAASAPPTARPTPSLDPAGPDDEPARAATAPAAAAATPVRSRRTSPSRPPATGVVALVALVIVVLAALLAARDRDTTGTAVRRLPETTVSEQTDATEAPNPPSEPSPTEATPSTRPPSTAIPSDGGAPRNWVPYKDPVTGFTISHPPNWAVSTNGSLTDFRDTNSAAYLRVDYTTEPGPSAAQAWYDLEPRFAAENPNYRRIQITPTTFKGYQAAIWEYTYTGRGTNVHAVDLGFVTGSYGFALNFQTRASDWERMQDVFDAFKASFKAPTP